MHLYLVQHGQAHPKEMDPERGLTDKGRQDVEKVASFVARLNMEVAALWESGKKRATQTAEILASSVTSRGGLITRTDIAPMDPVVPVAEAVKGLEEDHVIVGHLPFLPRLASALLAGDSERVGFGMVEAAVLHLHKSGGRWFVLSMLTPAESGVRQPETETEKRRNEETAQDPKP